MNKTTDAASTSTDPSEPAEGRAPIQFVVALTDNLPILGGRRSWMQYLDLGVTEATHGRMRAQRTKITEGYYEVTGWHYHLCELQWIYVVNGWLDLQLEDGSELHMEVGDSALLPGGFRHNEVGMAPDLDVLEISLPAKMGTVACDAPPAWMEKLAKAES